MNFSIAGLSVSQGIAIGRISLLERGSPDVPSYTLAEDLIEPEVERFSRAVDKTVAQLSSVRDRIPASAPTDIAAFIDTHLLMLDDSALRKVPAETIRSTGCNAEWALKLQRDALVNVFEEMDDPYLRTRKDDVIHVVNGILRSLQSPEDGSSHDDVPVMSNRIVVADDLTPADTILLHHQGIAALLTEYGGPLSHTAILARSLRIPMLVGVHGARQCLRNNDQVILDGHFGQLVVTEDAEMLRQYRELQLKDQRHFASLDRLRDEPAVTTDGVEVQLQANIELPGDIEMLEQAGATGVGLFRTEFLFMNRSQMPDEEEQFEVYRSVVKALQGKPLTLRTLDLGADKTVDGEVASTTNPALGLRAIRLCLHDPDLFYPQLRAILRASVYGPVRLMVPMMSSLVELRQVQRIIGMVKQELRQAGKGFDEHIPVGAMIEVPSAALQAYHFASELDFLSIGTNDLVQYTMAIDRVDDEVNYLYDPLNPAVLRLIFLSLRAGKRAGVPVAMCGEMAGDRRFTRLLLGMGLREFSMQATSCLDVKDIIRQTDSRTLPRLVKQILSSADQDEIDHLLTQLNA